jgi:flagellar hook assembly protein FlgD
VVIANGSYFLKVDSLDAYGTVSSVIKTVTVNRPLRTVTVSIYNQAGEVARNLLGETTVPRKPDQQMTLSTNVFQPGGDGTDGSPTSVEILISGEAALTWDGRSNNGHFVSDGSYDVEATIENPGQASQVTIRSVSVLGSTSSAGRVTIRPNVLDGSHPNATFHVEGLKPTQRIRAKIHTLTGALVAVLEGSVGQNDLVWHSSTVASGLYIVAIETWDGSGMSGRAIAKMVVQQ